MAGKAGIYVRVSVDRDGASESPDRQLADCRAVADRRGVEVADVYEDRDASAFSTARRPEYERLIDDARAGRIDTIIVWKLDRITRKGLRGAADLLDLGVTLVSATEGQLDEMVLGVLASMARQESTNTSLRVKRARLAAAQAGKMSTGGPRPYGYTRAGEIVPEEAEVIREAAKRAIAGESFRAIAVSLNERGVVTSTGKQWQASPLADMLRSPLRAGFVVHQGEIIGEAPERRIITPHQHEQLKTTRGVPRAHRSQAHLLAGIIYCAECGGRMKSMGWVMKNGRTFPRYSCVKQPGQVNCGGVNATEKGLDDHVKVKLFEILSGAKLHPQVRGPELDEAQLRQLLDADEAALNDLSRMRFVDRVIRTDAEYLAALAPLHERMDRTKAALDALADERRRVDAVHGLRPGSIDDLEAWWSTASEVEKRDAVREYVTRVEVSKAKHRGGNVFDTTRVSIGFDWSLLVRIAGKAWDEATDDERAQAERELRDVEWAETMAAHGEG